MAGFESLNDANKKVSLRLAAGILFIPVIFSWVTLKKGYSTKARVIAFAWFSIFGILTLLNDDKSVSMPTTVQTQPAQTANPEQKAIAFEGLSDCELTKLILKDYMPLMMSLDQLIESKPTYQQANAWKINSNFDAKISEIESKYPRHYSVDFVNARLASGLNVRLGQLWREVFFSLRNTDNNGPIKSEQWSMVESELNQIMANCKV